MKKLLITLFVGIPLVACGETTVVHQAAPAETPATTPEETAEPTDPAPDTDPAKETPKTPVSNLPEDRCLDGQDLNAADVDISACPALPSIPDTVPYGKDDEFDLGAWEMGTLTNGETYKYGTLTTPVAGGTRKLTYDGGSADVNQGELDCWAKSYYRLRKILQDPPIEYVTLRKAGFQYRFFQFQSDLRNGPTGYKAISSFEDHLVKWVSVISKSGVCTAPTLQAFIDYAKDELDTRGIEVPK